jgi:hypothetical protein
MAYVPPQVNVTQVQQTFSPTLIEPDLVPAVVGPAYQVEYIDTTQASPYGVFLGTQVVLTVSSLSGFRSGMALDTNSVYADLVSPLGTRTLLTPGNGLTVTSSTVTISANAACSGQSLYIGYRALRSDMSNVYTYESATEIENDFGDTSSFNPQGLGLMTALENANTSVVSYAISTDGYTGIVASGLSESVVHANAMEALSTFEVYTIAPMTTNTSILGSWKSHVDTLSVPTAKHERILFSAPKIAWSDGGVNPYSSTVKAATATAIANNASAISDSRVFSVFPDTAFVQETRHISTLSPTYIANMYTVGLGFSTSAAAYAYLAQNVTFPSSVSIPTQFSGQQVFAGDQITSALYVALVAYANLTGNVEFAVTVPVPSSVLATSAIVGQIAGKAPQAPLTNVAVGGIDHMMFGSDIMNETNLNTIASGGVYILKQAKITSPIVCRHQLSTNMSSVQSRELSVTTALDYSAKFYRNTVGVFIGKYVINASSLRMVSIALKAASDVLKKQGTVNSATVASVIQDPNSSDTVDATVNLGLAYPLNYINLYLVF